MALAKTTTLTNGVQVAYHRVVSVTVVTNIHDIIEVCSYTSDAMRAREQAALATGNTMDVYLHTSLYDAPYDPAMTVDSAYSYLKGLPEYAGATDC